jgi:hypothetical protein
MQSGRTFFCIDHTACNFALCLQELEDEWEKAKLLLKETPAGLAYGVPFTDCCLSVSMYLQELEEEEEKAKPLPIEIGIAGRRSQAYEHFLFADAHCASLLLRIVSAGA